MSTEELGEVKIIITSGPPKIIATTFKEGYPIEVTIEKIESIHEEGCNKIIIENMIIQSSLGKVKKR